MLNVLRKKGVAKKILWFVAGIIVLSFGFMGQAYLLSDTSSVTYAGKVFGKKVTFEEFEHQFRQTSIQAMIQYGDNFYKLREYLNLEAQTWDRIILLTEAEKRRIRIADAAVVDAINNYKFFQRDGKFDRLLYNDVLKFIFRVTPRDFEEGVRDTLKFAKLFEEETTALNIPEEEIFSAYKRQNEKVQISYLLFPTEESINQVAFDEGKAKEYYESHKDEFLLPEMINVAYIRADFPPDAAQADKDAAQEKAVALTKELALNPDLGAVAAKNNIPVEETGLFSMEQPNLKAGWSFEILQQIFQYKTGQVSDPILTASGYQILQLKEKHPAHIPDYEQAKDKVKEAYSRSEAKVLTQQKATDALKSIRETYDAQRRPDFIEIAKGLRFNMEQTPVFSRGEYLPKIGLSKDFQDTAFSLTETSRLSDVVATEKGSCLLYLDSILPVDMDDYAKHKEEFQQKLLAEKKNTKFTDLLTRLRLKSNLEDNIAKRKAKQG